eukprot:6214847-Pleurochrysis_carterae.AAC.10
MRTIHRLNPFVHAIRAARVERACLRCASFPHHRRRKWRSTLRALITVRAQRWAGLAKARAKLRRLGCSKSGATSDRGA